MTSIDINSDTDDYDFPKELSQEITQKVGYSKLMSMLVDTSLAELDVSGIVFGAEGAEAIAEYIKDNGALTSLNVSKNALSGIDEYSEYDALDMTALADAIGEHQ